MNEVMQKLGEHDEIFKQIAQRFDDVDKRFKQVDKRFDDVDKRFGQVDEQFDVLARKLMEHDERLDRIEANMATKTDINKIMVTLDTLVGMYKTNEQERTFLAHGLRKTEGRVEILEHDVAKMKPALGLS